MQVTPTNIKNDLYPIYLKLDKLNVLLVGAGHVALEKLQSILINSPSANVTLVAPQIADEVTNFIATYSSVIYKKKAYSQEDLSGIHVVIAATNDVELHKQILQDAHEQGILVNVVDTPHLCDFYLSSIVQKGDLKIAISTNGKSPTMAKRLKETLNEVIPADMDELLQNMHAIRNKLSGDLSSKVKALNEVTKNWHVASSPLPDIDNPNVADVVDSNELVQSVKRYSNRYLIGLGLLLLIALAVYTIYAFGFTDSILQFVNKDNHRFYWMLLTGFLAEIVAGSMGMGYGVICTSILLMLNVPPLAVSTSIHTAESFTTAAGSISHWKLGNINKKLIKALAIPAIFGAILGALSLKYFGKNYANIVKPIIALYTLYLGVKILMNAFEKRKIDKKARAKKTNITALGLVGGFIDSFAGGGWGPLVTGTFIKNGRTPRYVVGSSTVAKFILTVVSAIVLTILISAEGAAPWNIVAGLLLGGIITAPFSAMLTARVPVKKMFVIVGVVVIIMSLITIVKAILK